MNNILVVLLVELPSLGSFIDGMERVFVQTPFMIYVRIHFENLRVTLIRGNDKHVLSTNPPDILAELSMVLQNDGDSAVERPVFRR